MVKMVREDEISNLKLENMLQESDAKYHMLFEHTSDAVLVFDGRGRFLEANPKIYQMLGYTREEFMRLKPEDLVPAEDLAKVPINYDEFRGGKTIRRTRRLLRKDGTLVEVEIVGSMISTGKMQSIVRRVAAQHEEAETTDREQRNGLMMAQMLRSIQSEGASSPRLKLMKELSGALSTALEFLEHSQTAEPSSELHVRRGMDFYEEVGRFEMNLIKRALQQTFGNQKRAAQLLGVKQTTLHAMIKRYGIDIRELFEMADAPDSDPA